MIDDGVPTVERSLLAEERRRRRIADRYAMTLKEGWCW